MTRLAAALTTVLVVSCARASPPADGGEPPGERSGPQLYEITTIVLEDASHGPMLCPGGVITTDPIQCGNVPTSNWDWDAVDGERRKSGTIWGQFHLVGTYNGQRFTVTQVGPPGNAPDPFDDDDPIEAGCPEPEGGWAWPDPNLASEADLTAAQVVAQREPDFAGFWIDYLSTPNPRTPYDAQQIVITAAFTGDLERHEAQLRGVWGGPLCVVAHTRSYRELKAIQRELTPQGAKELGLQLLSSDIDVEGNVVEIHVVALDEEARQALDERFGQGTVRATAALQPVSD